MAEQTPVPALGQEVQTAEMETADAIPQDTLTALGEHGFNPAAVDPDGNPLANEDGSITFDYNPNGGVPSDATEPSGADVTSTENPVGSDEVTGGRPEHSTSRTRRLAAMALAFAVIGNGLGGMPKTEESEREVPITVPVKHEVTTTTEHITTVLPPAEYVEEYDAPPASGRVTPEAQATIEDLVRKIKYVQDEGGTVNAIVIGGRVSAEDDSLTNAGLDQHSAKNEELGITRAATTFLELADQMVGEGVTPPSQVTIGLVKGDVMPPKDLREMSLLAKQHGMPIDKLVQDYNDGKVRDPRLDELLKDNRGSYIEVTYSLPSRTEVDGVEVVTIKIPIEKVTNGHNTPPDAYLPADVWYRQHERPVRNGKYPSVDRRGGHHTSPAYHNIQPTTLNNGRGAGKPMNRKGRG